MKKIRVILGALLVFLSVHINAQEDDKSLKIGLNLGAYLPSKSYAQFLDGSHPNGVNRILNDPNIRPQLEEALGYPITDWSFPTNMRYNISLFAGGYFGYELNNDVSFVLNTNLTRVSLEQVLLIRLDNPQNIQGQFHQGIISADERRFDIALGVETIFNEYGPLDFYAAGGGLVNYTQLEKHELRVSTFNYSIMRINVVGNQNQVIRGFGYGFFTQFGTRFKFNEQLSVDLGIELNVLTNRAYVNDLVENTGYSEELADKARGFKLNGNAYFRIIWN